MRIRRTGIAAFTACFILLVFTAHAYPSYNSEAGRKYAVATQRLADLKKSSKKKKYRSYWVDCIRTFELVEKKYPKSPSAGDACFDRATLYYELYQISRYSRDLDTSMRVYEKCQAANAGHPKASESLYRLIDLSIRFNRNRTAASRAYAKLSESYPSSHWTTKAKALLGKDRKPVPEIRKMPKRAEQPGPAAEVKGIRHWSGGSYTRVVIDQDRPVKFQVLELKDRLVFDLLNSRAGDSISSSEPLPVHDGILKQVRASQFTPDTVRVVLDVASIKSYAAFPLHDPERLVIDVTGDDEKGGQTPSGSQDPEPIPSGAGGVDARNQAVTAAASSKGDSGDKLSISRQLGLKIKTIAIDAGHGGHDPGAIGKGGLQEKEITLDIAKRLAGLVKEGIGCDVVMTRDRDTFIPLEERPAIARTKGADLFVSIHVNASRKRRARGIETYIQGLRASDRDAMATAARENATTSKTLGELDDELSRILKGLRMESNDEDSIHLAHAVQGSLVSAMKPIQGTVVNLGVKRAFFYVLINTGMPSILAEVGFISNPGEEKMLKKDSYRQAIAEALYEGVKKYVDSRTPKMAGA